MKTEKSYLYLFSCNKGPLKIGVTKTIKARVKSLQCGSPYRIKHIASFSLPTEKAFFAESLCHENLTPFRLVGEWFNIPIKDAIAAMKESIVEILGPVNIRNLRHPDIKNKKAKERARKAMHGSRFMKKKPGRKKTLSPIEINNAEQEWFNSNMTIAAISKKYRVANNYFFREFGGRGFIAKSPKRTKVRVKQGKKKPRKATISKSQWTFMLGVVANSPRISAGKLCALEEMPKFKRKIPKRTTLMNYMDALRAGEDYPFVNF